MTVSHHPPMNEELLSAYLDNEVTDEERSLVEAAIATDPAIAWQVDSLRQTIHLLHELPALALPRAFTIEAIVAEAKGQEARSTPAPNMGVPSIGNKPAFAQQVAKAEQPSDWWQWLQQIWQGGNLPLRNAAAFAFTLMLVLFVSNRFVAPYQPIGVQANAPISQTTINGTGSGNSTATAARTRVTTPRETTPTLEPSAKALAAQPPVAVAVIQEQAVETASTKLPIQNETTTAESTAMTLRSPVQGPGPDEDDFTGDSPNAVMQSEQPGSVASPMQDNARTAATADFAQSANASTSLTTSLLTTVTANYSAQNQTASVTGTLTDSVIVETVTPSVSLSTAITASLEQSAPTEAVRDEMTNRSGNVNRWLGWAQLITALCAVVLGGLWWRSRE